MWRKILRGYVYGIFSFFFHFIQSFFLYNITLNPHYCNREVLFLGLSKNNKLALMPIYYKIEMGKSINLCEKRKFTMWLVYWYSFPYFFKLIKVIKKSSREYREIIKNHFETFWCTYGCYRLSDKILNYYNPKILIVANDHNSLQRCFIDIANKKNIVTIYVQHASVTEKFPPLNFTYSFLDGKESLEKYLFNKKSKGNVYLSGGVRFDNCVKKKNDNFIFTNDTFNIGIAINTLDEIDEVKSLCFKLMSKSINGKKVRLILRQHPSSNQKRLFKWCLNNQIEYSDSFIEKPFDFLSKIDILIANESSIHLDAVIFGIPSLLYNMSKLSIRDWYGYVKNKLIKVAISPEEIIGIITNERDLFPAINIIKYYHAAYSTSYERKVSDIISLFINLVISGNEEQFDNMLGFKSLKYNDSISVKFLDN
jgi:hypothetical protein